MSTTLDLSSRQLEDSAPPAGWSERYTVGCDLGQAHDPTAIAIVRRLDAATVKPIFQVGHLQRLPLGTPYPGVVTHVGRMLGRPPLKGNCELVIDFTGVGRPVFDMFVGAGISPIGVSITSGDAVVNEGMIYKVPKLILISRVQALLHDGRLKIHKGLVDAPGLVAELQDFKAEVTDSGYWKFGARAGKHDDLVLAVAIALWRAHGDNMPGWGILEYYRQMANGFGVGTPVSAPENKVRVRVLNGSSSVSGITGRMYQVDARGEIDASIEDAAQFVRMIGFQRADIVQTETEAA